MAQNYKSALTTSLRARRHARTPLSTAFLPVLIVLPTLALIVLLFALEAKAPYCSELKQMAELAATKGGFSLISGKPREGNFIESDLVLAGWNDCSVYGTRTYTCDTQPFKTAQEVEDAQVRILDRVQVCLGESWTEAEDRSSLGFIVLQDAHRPVSITLSIAQTDQKEYVVRLILFSRTD